MESFFAPFHKPRILVIFFVPSRSKRNKARLHFYYRLRNTNRNSILFGYSSPSLFFFITKNRYVFFSLPLIPLQLLGHYESIVQSFRIWSFATYTSKLSHWTIYFSDRVPCSRKPTEATNKLSRGWKIKRFWGFVPFIKLLCTFFLLWSYKREIRKQLFSETEATYREVFNLPAFPHRLHRGFSRKNIDLIEQNKLLRKRCKFLKNLCEVSHFLHIFTLCPDLSPMDEGIDEENF